MKKIDESIFIDMTLPLSGSINSKLFPRKSIKLILQQESSECGLACLAMIAQHYGNNVKIDDLRSRFEVPTRGATLAIIAHWADQIDLNARCVELLVEDLNKLKLPAILHWAGNHWVVLSAINGRGIKLLDPLEGERWVGWSEVNEKFSSHAVDFVPRTQLKRISPKPRLQLSILMRSFPGIWLILFQLLAISIVLEIIALLTPYYTQIVMDHVLVTGDIDLLNVVALGAGFLLMFQTFFSALRGWAGVNLSQNVGYQLYVHVIQHLFKLPVQFFVKRQTGDLVSRFDSLGQLAQTLTRTSIEIVLDAIISIGTLVMMFFYSSTLAWLAVGVFLTMLISKIVVFSSSQRVVSERVFFDTKRKSHLIESIRGIRSIKSSGANLIRSQQWIDFTRKIQENDASTERINLLSTLLLTTCTGLAHLIAVYLAAQMILISQLSIGMLFAFIAYQASFTSRASAFADRLLWLRTMSVHFDRAEDIIFSHPENDIGVALTPKPKASGLDVINIGYKYSNADPFIFRGITLQVNPGEILAITGSSGVGKTTLLSVLGGILFPVEGSLVYDGERMHSENSVALRKRLSFVFQNDELFEGSIEDNISFFAKPIDRERIKRCSAIACISKDIESWPQGYRTRLMEQGAGISGGQRQRLLIARALYLDPSLLILDEATSHLDVETEKNLLHNLKKIGITIVMSAHRPDAIAFANRVYTIHGGKSIIKSV
jgi:ATP-binding cassette, subfamily B, bacterial CvaB/MchF/RaxB